jgi:hypothetical protein
MRELMSGKRDLRHSQSYQPNKNAPPRDNADFDIEGRIAGWQFGSVNDPGKLAGAPVLALPQ